MSSTAHMAELFDPAVSSPCTQCLQHIVVNLQAATVLGALAVAEPSSAASMLGDMMGKLSAAAPRLAAMRTPGKGEPPVSGNRGESLVQTRQHQISQPLSSAVVRNQHRPWCSRLIS